MVRPAGIGYHAPEIIRARRRGFFRLAGGEPNPTGVREIIGFLDTIEADPFCATPVGGVEQTHAPTRRPAPGGNLSILVPDADLPETLRRGRSAVCPRKAYWMDWSGRNFPAVPQIALVPCQIFFRLKRREFHRRFAFVHARLNANSSSSAAARRQCPADFPDFRNASGHGGGLETNPGQQARHKTKSILRRRIRIMEIDIAKLRHPGGG